MKACIIRRIASQFFLVSLDSHFVCPVPSFSEMKEIGWRKVLGFRKTVKPGLTWLTGIYAPDHGFDKVIHAILIILQLLILVFVVYKYISRWFAVSDFGLFLKDDDPVKGKWLEPARQLMFYPLNNGVSSSWSKALVFSSVIPFCLIC